MNSNQTGTFYKVSMVSRRKSGCYNTTDTTSVSPQFQWLNEGLVSASHLKKPACDELSLAQWASGHLSNILLVEDQALSRSMLVQMAAALKDAVALPWPVVRLAWAVSMTDIEEGRLNWTDSMQWSLNRTIFLTIFLQIGFEKMFQSILSGVPWFSG